MKSAKCEMIHAHHPDCTCEWCKAHVDEKCGQPVVATLYDGKRPVLRVCDECAISMHLEADVYTVRRDDGLPVFSN